MRALWLPFVFVLNACLAANAQAGIYRWAESLLQVSLGRVPPRLFEVPNCPVRGLDGLLRPKPGAKHAQRTHPAEGRAPQSDARLHFIHHFLS